VYSYVDLDNAQGVRVRLTVPSPRTVTEFAAISVHSFDDDITLASLTLPSPLLIPPNLDAGLLRIPIYAGRVHSLVSVCPQQQLQQRRAYVLTPLSDG